MSICRTLKFPKVVEQIIDQYLKIPIFNFSPRNQVVPHSRKNHSYYISCFFIDEITKYIQGIETFIRILEPFVFGHDRYNLYGQERTLCNVFKKRLKFMQRRLRYLTKRNK